MLLSFHNSCKSLQRSRKAPAVAKNKKAATEEKNKEALAGEKKPMFLVNDLFYKGLKKKLSKGNITEEKAAQLERKFEKLHDDCTGCKIKNEVNNDYERRRKMI